MKKSELIFFPLPSVGHLASSLELAHLLINHHNNLSITFLSIKLSQTLSSHSYITSHLSSHPQIQILDLPHVQPPPQDLFKSPSHYVLTFMRTLIPHVKATLENVLSTCSNQVIGLVLDFFCVPMVDVGNELGIPSYLFMPSNVGFLSFMLSLHNRQIDDVFNDSDPELLLPGFNNLVPSSVLPDAVFDKEGGYFSYYNFAERFRDTKGIIVNSFSELEGYAVDALFHGQSQSQIPPIYAVGPLINLKGHPNPKSDQAQHDKILKWLDEQPHCSVVFLCFGSRGSFDPSQIREIALALWHSGVRFLWAMGSTFTSQPSLPKEFLEWMEGKGMMCEWAPQVEVLAHEAIGGFVSHCGWNSILESLWFGVPILAWPIYAEQQLNAFRMVSEWGLAVELRLDYRTGSDVVMAEKIEKGLKQLMDRDNVVHKRVEEMKEMARNAITRGGSSFISVGKLVGNMT